MNTLIYIWVKDNFLIEKGENEVVCKGCFNCQLWGELVALTLGIGLVFGAVVLMFT